ncbi:MAG: DNA-3-methyladenine glycosylase I [Flavobacteriaceae bacterium]|jgi:DNA-3-methyladenine glycosylase I|nr:DNA-3-methyladenine glycosylase I [Flavobacteriaceae bacterium]
MSQQRCPWCEAHSDYKHYHDTEWGVPIRDDESLFATLLLETFQAGLSWLAILRKRENFRRAFDDFDVHKVAAYGPEKIEALCMDKGIIRNRMKIEAAVNNAKAFQNVQKTYGSFSEYIWAFVNNKPVQNAFTHLGQIPTKTILSERVCLSLKKNGFKFIGSVIVYSHMQANGMINDHLVSCFRHEEVKKLA